MTSLVILFTETPGDNCGVHLINEGLTIDGQIATVQVQGTGPSAADRITEFSCRFDSGQDFLCEFSIISIT